MLYAKAIVLRGSYISPPLVAIELRKLQKYGHAGILLSDGSIVEASAWKNEVVRRTHPCELYNYEQVLELRTLGLAVQQRIADLALAMVGWKYDWRAFKSQAVENILPYAQEDTYRVLCFELVALATKEFFSYYTPYHLVDSSSILGAYDEHFNPRMLQRHC